MQGKIATSAVNTLLAVLSKKDPYTCDHSIHVGFLSAKLALELGCGKEMSEDLNLAGHAHDLGKITWPDICFDSKTKSELSAYSYPCNICDLMEVHPLYSLMFIEKILSPLNTPIDTIRFMPWILFHHWGYDKNNRHYPLYAGKVSKYYDSVCTNFGKSVIDLGIGIMKVADSFQAAISNRKHRTPQQPKKVDDAIDELFKDRGTNYHPEVVDAIIKMKYLLKNEYLPHITPKQPDFFENCYFSGDRGS